MALQNTKQNVAQRMYQGARDTFNNIGQALPVLGNNIAQNAKQGLQSLTSPFQKKKPLVKNYQQNSKDIWAERGKQIKNGVFNERQQLDQINQLTR